LNHHMFHPPSVWWWNSPTTFFGWITIYEPTTCVWNSP
jgi:hypothetical protein